jgi:hypothetical protein
MNSGKLLETIDLRDYFAAKVMQGLIGCSNWREQLGNVDIGIDTTDFTAHTAYMMADAMLKAREE